eukprot:188235-Prymnesium_polylepis.1
MTWACEVAAMRLLKKCKKETLVALCNDFGIPTSGNKEKLAEDAAEQMGTTRRTTSPTTTSRRGRHVAQPPVSWEPLGRVDRCPSV